MHIELKWMARCATDQKATSIISQAHTTLWLLWNVQVKIASGEIATNCKRWSLITGDIQIYLNNVNTYGTPSRHRITKDATIIRAALSQVSTFTLLIIRFGCFIFIQQTLSIHLLLAQCWATVYGTDPALNQNWLTLTAPGLTLDVRIWRL